MKTILSTIAIALAIGCSNSESPSIQAQPGEEASKPAGQSGVSDNVSNPNIVQVAVGSPDHSTLVAAVKAAELVDALSNAGPFTVFAPVNAAFDKIPKATLDELLTPAKKADLQNILEYHVSVGVYKADALTDGRSLGQVNGKNIKITVKDNKVMVNDNATIIASVPASNGIIHVIDGVLLPN